MQILWEIYEAVTVAYMRFMVMVGGTNQDGTMNVWGLFLMILWQIATTLFMIVVVLGVIFFVFFFVLDTFLFEGGETSSMWYHLKCHTFVKCY